MRIQYPPWRTWPTTKPEASGSYLVAIRNGSRQAVTYCKSEKHWGPYDITHWTDLPDHPPGV